MMAIADLTGTMWVINALPSTPSSSIFASLAFLSNSEPFTALTIYDEMDGETIGYRNPEVLEFPVIAYDRYGGWANEAYRTISISGGEDATNASLIAWLEANAVQQTPVVPDISITYNGNEIATMSDSGTKTLATAGKYLEGNVTVTYTKSGGGGGGGKLYIFSNPAYFNWAASAGNTNLHERSAFNHTALVQGATVTFYTYGSYILDHVTGEESGDTYPFTTVRRGQYTFTMPGESVYCALLYDD